MTNLNYNQKHLDLFEKFMEYINFSKKDIDFPNKSNFVIFDENDQTFSNQSKSLFKNLMKLNTPNLVQVYKTESKQSPWRVSLYNI